jgi:hypothetical protein
LEGRGGHPSLHAQDTPRADPKVVLVILPVLLHVLCTLIHTNVTVESPKSYASPIVGQDLSSSDLLHHEGSYPTRVLGSPAFPHRRHDRGGTAPAFGLRFGGALNHWRVGLGLRFRELLNHRLQMFLGHFFRHRGGHRFD